MSAWVTNARQGKLACSQCGRNCTCSQTITLNNFDNQSNKTKTEFYSLPGISFFGNRKARRRAAALSRKR